MLTTDSERSAVIYAGSNISFICRSEHHYHNSHVRWSYEKNIDIKPVVVHDGKRLHPGYASKLGVRYDSASRQSMLTISNATPSDDGVYMCFESDSATDGIDFHLHVVFG